MAFIYLHDKNSNNTKNEITTINKILENNNKNKCNMIFDKILQRVYNRIKIAMRQNRSNVVYMVPYFILGCTVYNYTDCIAYLIYKLNEEEFEAKFLHPHNIIISWNAINLRNMS
jgi:hypothetical protein